MRQAALLLVLAVAGCLEGPPPRVVAGGDVGRGKDFLRTYGCGECHVIPGVPGADATLGPPLDAWGVRGTIAGTLPNTPEDLIRFIMAPESIEPGTAMPNLGVGEAEARDMAAYLFTLREPNPLGPRHLFPVEIIERLGGLR